MIGVDDFEDESWRDRIEHEPEQPSNVYKLSAGKAKSRKRAEEPGGDVIKLGTDVHRVVDDCASALLRCEHVFCRSGELVRVIRDGEPPAGVERVPGSPSIRSVGNSTLLEELTRVQGFVKFDVRAGSWIPATPNGVVLGALSARGAWNGMRPLRGVLEAPALRPDGSIIQEPGYDVATGYLYEPTSSFPPVAERPSKADAIAARDALLEVVEDFPFASDEHRSAWLAFALTLFARPAVDGCIPFMVVDATSPGTGKGRLTDATAILATGREATKTPLPQDDEECRKRITALLIEGERLAVLDNVSDAIALPSLDAALTATVWRDRLLGQNASVTIENLMTWAANGNNVIIGGDLARRTLHIRLESRVEDPENRTDFRHHPLLPWVHAERPRLAAAALTILRAHAVAGRPRCGVKLWGSFESWSAVVASAVAFVDLPDPQATRAGLDASADASKLAVRGLLEGWARLSRDLPDGMTTKAAIEVLYSADRLRGHEAPDGYDDLREAIEALVQTQPGKAPSPTKLGYRMRAVRRRLIGGRMLDGEPDRNGVVRWRILGSKGAGDAGVEGHVPNPSRETVKANSDSSGSTGGNIASKPRIPRSEGGLS